MSEGIKELKLIQEEDLQYQDFVTDKMHELLGWNLNCYASLKWNIEKGESLSRIEIKNDRQMESTGNLYIETAERCWNENKPSFVPSGIFREDNTLLWWVGDYKRAFIMSKRLLKALYYKVNFKKVETATSQGFLIPISYINKNPWVIIEELYF